MTKDKDVKLIIVANRLPVKGMISGEMISFEKSAGGLATGLDSLNISYEKHWIGWPGVYTGDKGKKAKISEYLSALNMHPVFLSRKETELYYKGYCNSTIWPLFHYFYAYTRHDPGFWEAYRKVNLLFAEKVKEIAGSRDIIWIHDYHLMLLPMMIREHFPTVRIGFFLHIPFPSSELFRTLQNRDELITGLLGADLIGFHTYSYMRHFMSTLYRLKGLESDNNTFHYENRIFSVESFPMGINFSNFYKAHKDPEVKDTVQHLREQYPGRKIVLSVDRLDYSKGLLQRLEGFRHLLAEHPEWIGKVSLIIILVPSRDNVDKYHQLKVGIDETIGNINGTYSHPGWVPIHYFYQSFGFKELTAFYFVSDIMLVTPLRDGMNLVAKEYVAAKANDPGVLILSEMAGASVELTESLQVNPNNIAQIADSLHLAMIMPPEEQKARLKKMQKVLKSQDVVRWAEDFIGQLEKVYKRQADIFKKNLNLKQLKTITNLYNNSSRRLLLLDYDGTLVPFTNNPSEALPSPDLLKLLRDLSQIRGVDIAIISGRSRDFLDAIFRDSEMMIFAEHGAYRRIRSEWTSLSRHNVSWQPEILRIMQDITDDTPGSVIEKKETAVVWHYRKTDKWLADLRVIQLVNRLVNPCTLGKLQLMRGNKIIEVKPSEYSKGTAITGYFDFGRYDFILAAGDDVTDEDMFEVLPGNAVTIKIGRPTDKSKYTIATTRDFIKFLTLLKNEH